ncbi:hypothetical protein ACFPOU_23760 [Massilia jejuensis]|uniref:Uncharacterized protein n=1 Tax=Massilia jejuensis TaxID=648894 RepID=A0ABW0PP47_9BURK
MKTRVIPNPKSELLSKALVGGAGLGLPPALEVPVGMAAVLLFVPMETMIGKSMPEIQQDLGLPWHAGNGDGVWFDELV